MWLKGLCLLLVVATSVYSLCASAEGAHRLHYTISMSSKNGSVQQGFLAQGYWDGEPFLHYDSETGQAEPRAPWAESHLGAKDLVTEKEELGQRGRELRMTMADFQQEGLHSLQETLGCELQEDNTLIGFWEYRCAGELLLDYVPGTQTWKLLPSSFQPLAEKIKKKWNLDRDRHQDYSHHVQGDMCTKLQKYLIFWNSSQAQTGPSAVSVTCNKTTEHTTGLTCCTSAFSTKPSSLTWLCDGQPLNQHNQSRWGDLSRGNVTWVSTEVPQGEEQKYSCRVELGTNSSVHPVPCGVTLLRKNLWRIIAVTCSVPSVAVVIPMIVYICLRILKRRRTSGQESPDMPGMLPPPPITLLEMKENIRPFLVRESWVRGASGAVHPEWTAEGTATHNGRALLSEPSMAPESMGSLCEHPATQTHCHLVSAD